MKISDRGFRISDCPAHARAVSVHAVLRDQQSGHWSLVFGHRPFRGARRTAFTLVEVLIALAVFAFAAVVLGSAYVNILNSYNVAARGLAVNEDFDFARQLVLTEPDRKKLEQGGDFDTAQGRHAKWTVEITSTNEADVYDVNFNCEIQDPSRPEPDKVTQKFTVLRPTWVVDQAERDKLKEASKQRILEIQGKQQQQQSR